MSATAYLGIDVAKRKVDVALQRPDGKVRSKAVPNTPAGAAQLLAWVARYHEGPVHACLEATGTYGLALAERLADAGYVVSLINPARIAAYARSQEAAAHGGASRHGSRGSSIHKRHSISRRL